MTQTELSRFQAIELLSTCSNLLAVAADTLPRNQLLLKIKGDVNQLLATLALDPGLIPNPPTVTSLLVPPSNQR